MTTAKTYPPVVLKEELEKELGFKFFNKDYLNQKLESVVKVLKTDVRELFGKKKEQTVTTATVEIPDIFNARMKQEIEAKNDIIRRFEVPKKDFCLRNDSACIKNFVFNATAGKEYRDLAGFISRNKEYRSMSSININFNYYAEDIAKKAEKWNNIDIKYDTSKKIAQSFMKTFEEYMSNCLISSVYSKLEYNDISEQERKFTLELLEKINRYASAVGVYAPCSILGGMKYDVGDHKFDAFDSEPLSVSDRRLNGYIHSIIKLSYFMDYDYNGKIKRSCTKGSFLTLVG